MANDLASELDTSLAEHARWQGHDFAVAQVLWLGIAASAAAALNAAGAFEMWKWLAAVLAATPGLVILADKTFKFAVRSSWHALYGAGLRALKRDLRDRGVTPSEVAEELSQLEKEMEKLFPPLDSGTLGKAP